MMKAGMMIAILFLSLVFIAVGFPAPASAQTSPSIGVSGTEPSDDSAAAKSTAGSIDDDWEEEDESEEIEYIRDPLQPFNRAMFHFNDKLYYWALKPVARGYRFIVPQRARVCVRKFFSNAGTPVRLVNCILQGRMKGAGTEIGRFVVNTTAGIAGLFDPAQSFCRMSEQQADFDQTLGIYKMGPVIYINWPLLGPSSLRGTLGIIADMACDPTTYLLDTPVKMGIAVYEEVNETSLTIGNYEGLTESALDPYIAIRDAYYQNRKSLVESKKMDNVSSGWVITNIFR
jgi:phospholipid-binding lipoprotein MlaA